MQNILVTGGCGFIGANFVRFLLGEAGFAGRVVNFDKLTYAANPESLADIAAAFPERYVLVHADICNRKAVLNLKSVDGVPTLDGPSKKLGAEELYLPVCYVHYTEKLGIADARALRAARSLDMR